MVMRGKGGTAMALKQCRECGGKVSTAANTCPHCGIATPTQTDRQRAEATHKRAVSGIKSFLWLLVIVGAAAFFLRDGEKRSPQGIEEARAAEPQTPAQPQPKLQPKPKAPALAATPPGPGIAALEQV